MINLNGSDEYKICTIGNNNRDVIPNHNNQHANFLTTALEGRGVSGDKRNGGQGQQSITYLFRVLMIHLSHLFECGNTTECSVELIIFRFNICYLLCGCLI